MTSSSLGFVTVVRFGERCCVKKCRQPVAHHVVITCAQGHVHGHNAVCAEHLEGCEVWAYRRAQVGCDRGQDPDPGH
jgi:hypothetical protein